MARKMTVTEMRARCTDYFFSKATRHFFRGSRTYAKYDKASKQNYLKVKHRGRTAWYKFNAKTGKTDYIPIKDLPAKFRRKK